MSLDLRKAHVFKKIPGTANDYRLAEKHPAVAWTQDHEQIYLQDGKFYFAGGAPVTEWPGWLDAAIQRTNPIVLAEAGYRGKPSASEKPHKKAAAQPAA